MSTDASLARSLDGVVPMLPTLFDESGAVDLPALTRVVDHVIGLGPRGLAILGFGAECQVLTEEERFDIADTVLRSAGDLPVVVGCTASTTAHTFRLVQNAAARGVHAVMVGTPTEQAMEATEAFDFFSRVAGLVGGTAVMVQDAPQWSATSTGIGLVARLVQCFSSVRYAKPEAVPFADLTAELAAIPGLTVFAGLGGTGLLDSMRCGAKGVIPFAESTAVLAEVLQLAGTPEGEQKFLRALPLLTFQMQSLEHAILCSKLLLRHQGVDISPAMRLAAPKFGHVSHDLMIMHARTAEVLNS